MKATLEVINRISESKRKLRNELAALPFSEKLKLLEKLRARSLALAANPLRKSGTQHG